MTQPRSSVLNATAHHGAGAYRLCQLGPASSALIKTIHVDYQGAAAGYLTFYARRAGGSVGVGFTTLQVEPSAFAAWEGWIVLEDGDDLAVVVGGSDASWWVSGSVLAGTIDTATVPI